MKTDTEIKEDVLDELAWHPDIDETDIGVIVEDGIVTLTGFVDGYPKKMAAEKAAKEVAGVKAVASDIEVKYGNEYKKTDKEIAKAAVNALDWNATVPQEKILVKVDNGFVFLSGEVAWGYQKDAAKRTIENLLGVKGVFNNIEIVPIVEPGKVTEKILKAFERSADIDADHVTVTVQGSEVTLTGTVSSIKQKDDATNAAFHAPGVSKVKNQIKVQYNPTHAV